MAAMGRALPVVGHTAPRGPQHEDTDPSKMPRRSRPLLPRAPKADDNDREHDHHEGQQRRRRRNPLADKNSQARKETKPPLPSEDHQQRVARQPGRGQPRDRVGKTKSDAAMARPQPVARHTRPIVARRREYCLPASGGF